LSRAIFWAQVAIEGFNPSLQSFAVSLNHGKRNQTGGLKIRYLYAIFYGII